jgi:hypothetical protein
MRLILLATLGADIAPPGNAVADFMRPLEEPGILLFVWRLQSSRLASLHGVCLCNLVCTVPPLIPYGDSRLWLLSGVEPSSSLLSA